MSKPRFFYTLVLYLLLPFIPLRLLWRSRKQPAYLQHWRERFGWYSPATPTPSRPLIWIHAVSVGETRACVPLIAALQTRYPKHRILLTHMTPTGRETGQALFGARVLQAYLPYDFPGAVQRFLSHFQPQFGLLMETELWPNLIAACQQHHIPLALINARLSARSARGYARLPALARETLGALSLISAQTTADAERLQQLGANQPVITGNLKFDVVPPPANDQLRTEWGSERPTILAASTRDGEEVLLLDALPALTSNALLVIVPRYPQRFDSVAALLTARGIPFQRRSENAPLRAATRVVLGDSMGEMFAYYGAAEVAIIGGSLLPFGGQNLIEACALGVPVMIGPHTHNFAQAAQDAVNVGAALRVADAGAALSQAQALLQDTEQRKRMRAAALGFAAAHRGAVDKTMALIEEKLLGKS